MIHSLPWQFVSFSYRNWVGLILSFRGILSADPLIVNEAINLAVRVSHYDIEEEEGRATGNHVKLGTNYASCPRKSAPILNIFVRK
jgi:hypothetical protein